MCPIFYSFLFLGVGEWNGGMNIRHAHRHTDKQTCRLYDWPDGDNYKLSSYYLAQLKTCSTTNIKRTILKLWWCLVHSTERQKLLLMTNATCGGGSSWHKMAGLQMGWWELMTWHALMLQLLAGSSSLLIRHRTGGSSRLWGLAI